jgi:hypothetical protein
MQSTWGEHPGMIKSGGQKLKAPLTFILSPKGRGNGSNACLAPPGERPAPPLFAGTGEGEVDPATTAFNHTLNAP